ncbi:MAG: aspartate/glutamate racemase family protein [Cellvibrionaceae bacterium]
MLGVLGGMGPLATVDFLGKLVNHTAVDTDQQHIPMVVWSVPQIPDRSNHIVYGAESPFPALKRGILALQLSGASVVAMPCNTAHFWYEDLINSTGMEILHIADAVDYEVSQLPFSVNCVGVLATTGTADSSIYQSRLTKSERSVILPSEHDQKKVMEGITLAKSGQVNNAKKVFLRQIDSLKKRGADAIVLGCTELPAVLDESADLIDSNRALARRCIRWFDATYHGKTDLSGHKKINSIARSIRI